MSIEEAVEKSSAQLTVFIVKEALFCTVYEQSAWRFAQKVRPYKPVKKHIKKLGREIVSLGFPKSQLASIQDISVAKGFVVTDEPGWMEIRINEEPDLLFEDWKHSVETLHATSLLSVIPPNPGRDVACNVSTAVHDAMGSIVDEIRSYNVADHTPMQTMLFLIEIQNKLKLVRKMPE